MARRRHPDGRQEWIFVEPPLCSLGSADNPYVVRGWYEARNYDMFAMLADVRNGRGFAGTDTGDGFKPISKPRGFPTDASPEVRESYLEWDADGHSHSFHTVRQLLEYDWNQSTTCRGFVDPLNYKKWVATGQRRSPEHWCGDVSGPRVEKVSNEKMQELLSTSATSIEEEKDFPRYYTQISWQVSYAQAAGRFLDLLQGSLTSLGPYDDVRIVFWFDN